MCNALPNRIFFLISYKTIHNLYIYLYIIITCDDYDLEKRKYINGGCINKKSYIKKTFMIR